MGLAFGEGGGGDLGYEERAILTVSLRFLPDASGFRLSRRFWGSAFCAEDLIDPLLRT